MTLFIHPFIHLLKILFQKKIHISLKCTLEELKQDISSKTSIEPKYQRLFHLGREIKNSRRSLHALGLGRFNSFVLHLHSSQPKNHTLSNKRNKEAACSSSSSIGGSNRSINNNANYNMNDDDDDEICVIDTDARRRSQKREMELISRGIRERNQSNNNHNNANNASATSARHSTASREKYIVEILDSDDDSDDEIEVVEVTNKRSRSR